MQEWFILHAFSSHSPTNIKAKKIFLSESTACSNTKIFVETHPAKYTGFKIHRSCSKTFPSSISKRSTMTPAYLQQKDERAMRGNIHSRKFLFQTPRMYFMFFSKFFMLDRCETEQLMRVLTSFTFKINNFTTKCFKVYLTSQQQNKAV